MSKIITESEKADVLDGWMDTLLGKSQTRLLASCFIIQISQSIMYNTKFCFQTPGISHTVQTFML